MQQTENILLIEVGTEELPPKELLKLSFSLYTNFVSELIKNQLTYKKVKTFVTPKRLALQIHGMATHQQPRTIQRKGPAMQAAFDVNGKPTNAAVGFAASCKVAVEQLQKKETPTGCWLYFEETIPGQAINTLIPSMLERALTELLINKRMRWGSLQQSFVRPVHWLVLLLNDVAIDATIFKIQADRYTYGHRFHHPEKIYLKHAKDYERTLETVGMVIADFDKRLALIKEQAMALATTVGGQLLKDNKELLILNNGLVEYPVPLLGTFNQDFLTIPQEVLIAAMQEHQKCFPIITQDDHLMDKFILVSNIKSSDPKTVVDGNELVMHARLADAAFLYKEDCNHKLAMNLDKLKSVTFQAKLGTLYDKTLRIEQLAKIIAEQINADLEVTTRAATLCKTDLTMQMVYEFPELQGIMGYYYALHDNEPIAVATAIKEHYLPRMSQDFLPVTLPGICIAIADRIDTLVGLFAINKIPSGEKDPFALKRQALAVLKIIIEKSLPLDLQQLCQTAYDNYQRKLQNPDSVNKLLDFFFERLRFQYKALEATNKTANDEISANKIFEAVLAKRPTQPFDFHLRFIAVQAFQQLPAATNLAAANKRVKNILEQATQGIIHPLTINTMLFTDPAEQQLYQAIQQQATVIIPLRDQANYSEMLTAVANLRAPIDLFFEKVMVMTDDIKIKNNRLALLQELRNLFLEVADLSLL